MRTNFASAVVGLTLLCLGPRWWSPKALRSRTRACSTTPDRPGQRELRSAVPALRCGRGRIQQGLTLNRFGMAVSNGLFTTTLDYGANIFTGPSRWLEIRVAPFETSAFATLAPRQPLTPTPYAMYAPNAGTAASATSVPWLALTGVPAGLADGVDDNTLYSAGTGLMLQGTVFSLNTAFTDERYDGRYWKLTGNSGTTAGVSFLGTTDNQALEVKVNGARAFRLEPTTNAPNLIGGYSGNRVDSGAFGTVIAGGGSTFFPSVVSANHSVIGGGHQHRIGMNSVAATIAGGAANDIRTNSPGGAIGGGLGNDIGNDSQYATIPGGYINTIGTNSGWSAIGGGGWNSLGARSSAATIAGGTGNNLGNESDYSTIGGGSDNEIADHSLAATIAGGYWNSIGFYSRGSAIGGGTNNIIADDSPYSTIGGGQDNYVAAGGWEGHGVIAGGVENYIGSDCSHSAIGGGRQNNITADSWGTTIAGGFGNWIGTNCDYSAIGGGDGNAIAEQSRGGAIAGGYSQSIGVNADNSAMGGGMGNNIGDNSSVRYHCRRLPQPHSVQLVLRHDRGRPRQRRRVTMPIMPPSAAGATRSSAPTPIIPLSAAAISTPSETTPAAQPSLAAPATSSIPTPITPLFPAAATPRRASTANWLMPAADSQRRETPRPPCMWCVARPAPPLRANCSLMERVSRCECRQARHGHSTHWWWDAPPPAVLPPFDSWAPSKTRVPA